MRKDEISAASIVQDYNKRGIAPNWKHEVTQGILRVWLFCNSFIVELYIGSDNGESIPGTIKVTSKYQYCNTHSPQAIADDLMVESQLSKVDLELINATPVQDSVKWLTTVEIEEKYELAKGSVRRDIHRKKFTEDELKKVGRDWTIRMDAADRQYNK